MRKDLVKKENQFIRAGFSHKIYRPFSLAHTGITGWAFLFKEINN